MEFLEAYFGPVFEETGDGGDGGGDGGSGSGGGSGGSNSPPPGGG